MMRHSWVASTLALVLAIPILAACGQSQPAAPTAVPAAAATTAAAPGGRLFPTPTPDLAASPAAALPPANLVNGGTWTRPIPADPKSLNPLLAADRTSMSVMEMIFPRLLSRNPYTGAYDTSGAMAESWTVSDDGLTWTFKLHSGVEWSDGSPVTADDFKFTYDAIASEVESVWEAVWSNLARVEVVDPLTLRVTFKAVQCDGLGNLNVPWLPSHLYKPDFSDAVGTSNDDNPPVSAGPFLFRSWARGGSLVLNRNQRYWQGAPHLQSMVYQVVPDADQRIALLGSDSLSIADLDPAQLPQATTNPNLALFSHSDDGYDFLGFNLANPENPQPGRNAAGALETQDPHPILGDLRVRQAIAYAIDTKALIDSVYLKRGYPLASNILPLIPWAHDPTLAPYAFDPDQSRKLLEAAGWVDSNNDGFRDQEGKILSLNLLTNAENPLRQQLAKQIRDALSTVGIEVTIDARPRDQVITAMLAQTFDMVLFGWTGLGSDPNDDLLWSTKYDVPGSGFNFVSYHNAQIDDLLQRGVTMPGCRPEDRAPIYKQIERQIHDDLPYLFIAGGMVDTAYSRKWGGLQPAPWNFYWNVYQWYDATVQPTPAPPR